MEGAVRPEHPRAAQSSRGAAIVDADEGRFSRGLRILGDAWELLSERPRLFVLPLLSAVLTTLAALAIFLPVAVLTKDIDSWKVTVFIASAASAIPFVFIATWLNVGFLGMAHDHIEGREPSVRRGLALAWSRRRVILGWTLLSALLGTVISALRLLPFDGSEWVARIVGIVGEVAWALATYFVIPVLALHGDGVRGSLKRSATVFRRRWGETLTGNVGIGVIFGIVFIPACLLGLGGAEALDSGNTTLGVVLIGIAVLIAVPVLAVESALAELFALMLYREATDGIVVAPFREVDMRTSFEPKPAPLRQRIRAWWRNE